MPRVTKNRSRKTKGPRSRKPAKKKAPAEPAETSGAECQLVEDSSPPDLEVGAVAPAADMELFLWLINVGFLERLQSVKLNETNTVWNETMVPGGKPLWGSLVAYTANGCTKYGLVGGLNVLRRAGQAECYVTTYMIVQNAELPDVLRKSVAALKTEDFTVCRYLVILDIHEVQASWTIGPHSGTNLPIKISHYHDDVKGELLAFPEGVPW